MTGIIEHLIERVEALEKVFDTLTYATAEQLAWSKGRNSVNASDYKQAQKMVAKWNSKREKPFDEHYQPVIVSLINVENEEIDL
jgi:hypothetical protein